MPPTLTHPLTKEEYVLYNDMITRIRAVEHMATVHFLRGDSRRRQNTARAIEDAVGTFKSSLSSTDRANDGRGRGRGRSRAGVAPASVDAVVGHGCTFPYCPSGGTCEMCGLAEVRQQVLDAFTRKTRR
jgi:hypothetical protein